MSAKKLEVVFNIENTDLGAIALLGVLNKIEEESKIVHIDEKSFLDSLGHIGKVTAGWTKIYLVKKINFNEFKLFWLVHNFIHSGNKYYAQMGEQVVTIYWDIIKMKFNIPDDSCVMILRHDNSVYFVADSF